MDLRDEDETYEAKNNCKARTGDLVIRAQQSDSEHNLEVSFDIWNIKMFLSFLTYPRTKLCKAICTDTFD